MKARLSLALVLAIACGGSDPISPPPAPPPPPPAPVLAALRLTVPDSVVAGQAFALSVAALNASGQPDNAWSGQVSISSSAGTLEPSAVTVNAGAGTVQATLRNHTGSATITATSGTVQAIHPVFSLSGAPVARLVIEPSSFLLPSQGATTRLVARAFDASGAPTTAQVTWESSSTNAVTISAAGVATAVSASGSTQVTAHSGAIASQPSLGLVTQLAQGTTLVADAQVVSAPVPVDPGAPYGPGWRYRVRLKGVSPAVGAIVLASGATPLGGRVVSATPAGNEVDVVLELLPLGELMPGLDINQSFALTDYRPASASTVHQTPFNLSRPLETTFAWGPLDCKASANGGGAITLLPPTGSLVTYDVVPDLHLELAWSPVNGFQKLIVRGSIVGNLNANPRMSTAIDGSLECKVHLGTIILPIGGPVALFISPKIPLGLGFAIEGKISFGDFGFDLALAAGATIAMGIDCTQGCRAVSNATSSSSGSFKPIIPTASIDLQAEFGASGFGWAELALGQPFIPNLSLSALEAKLGLKQEVKLAGARAQANNPAYASEFRLAPFFSAGTAARIDSIASFLGITVAALKYDPAIPAISESPRGSLTVAPASVRASRSGQPGDSATFIVSLDPVTYLSAYAVESVEIYRKTSGSGATFFIDRLPGRCGDQTPSASGQPIFTCKTDFPASMVGQQTFYAFVKPRIGVALPVLLEIAPDSKALLTVDTSTVVDTGTVVVLNKTGRAGVALDECSKQTSSTAASFTSPTQACTIPGSSGTTVSAQITYSITTGSTITLTASGSVLAKHENGAPPPGGYAIAEFDVKVPSGSVRYEATGFIEATDDTPIDAQTRFEMHGPTQQFEEIVTGHPIKNINRTGVVGPGIYHISIDGKDRFTGAQSGAGRGEVRFNVTVVITRVP